MNIPKGKAEKLAFFQDLYQRSKNAAKSVQDEMKRHKEQYDGSKEIDGGAPAKVVRNITYELIESQVATYIPTPAVSPEMHSQRNIRNAKAIEMMLQGKRNKLPFERMNDIDERYTTIYGGSVWLVEFDDSIRTPTTIGDVKVTCLAPDHFFGQENVFEIEDMEYCFLRFPTTKDEIVRKYGVDESVAEAAENEEAIEGDATVDGDEYTATVVVCYYKDEDDLVCEYVFSGDVCLLDVSDYYARKRKVCAVCGQREGICACEKPEYEERSADEEEITHNIKLSDGSVLGPVSQVIVDGVPQTQMVSQVVKSPTGEMVFDDSQGFYAPALEMVEQPVTEPTVIPYYRPKRLPVVIRKNISQENSVFGQSDCAAIREQQQLINKIETRIAEKLLKAGVYAIVPNDYEGDLTAGILNQVLRSDASNYNQFGRIDMQPNTALDISEAERLYDHAKRILGISASYQGQADTTAQSGIAKQMQIQQSAGRLESKRRMKNAAYADIDRLIFEMMLAYADEPRPAAYKDVLGRWQNASFSRYDFLERDQNGKYYYNDQYLFACDASVDMEGNRPLLWQENRNNFMAGAYGNPQDPACQLIYWQNMENAHYPWARENVERLEAQIVQQMQAMQQQIAAQQQDIANHEGYEQYLMGEINKGGAVNGNNNVADANAV
jgi:hypothetical protein